MALRVRRHQQRAEHVVAYCLPGVAHFHQRHVLVGGGVEDELRLPVGEDLLESRRVLHVTGQRHDLRFGLVHAEPLLDVVQRELARLHQHQPRRCEAGELATELAADRAAGAGDQHGLAADHVLEVGGIDLHRLAAQQILDIHRPHGVDRDLAAHQVLDARHGEDMGACTYREVGRELQRRPPQLRAWPESRAAPCSPSEPAATCRCRQRTG